MSFDLAGWWLAVLGLGGIFGGLGWWAVWRKPKKPPSASDEPPPRFIDRG